jgi:hypothetical protein
MKIQNVIEILRIIFEGVALVDDRPAFKTLICLPASGMLTVFVKFLCGGKE